VGFSCGIIGLPNVGKTTLFNALTESDAQAENYPFCTVDPNNGIVAVPDKRLTDIAAIFKPEKVTPTTLEFVDIAGLVKGASQGEGLGNQFLAQIQQMDAIAHVVRCFQDENISHTYETIDPIRDMQVVETELLIRDLDMAQKRIKKQGKVASGGDKEAKLEVEALEIIEKALANGQKVSSLALNQTMLQRVENTPFLTRLPTLVIANISEDQIGSKTDEVLSGLVQMCNEHSLPLVEICAQTESELDELEPDERQAYMAELGIAESGLSQVITVGYRLLKLVSFFTTVGTEVRAWTVLDGTMAVKAAGRIHTDMERGFIRAEVVGAEALLEYGSEQAIREKGLVRLEGKEYIVQDGDVIRFRFNV